MEHGSAVLWLVRYIHGTADKGIIYRPDRRRGLEVFVDADFSGNYHKEDCENPDTTRSRHGYIIIYAGLPIKNKEYYKAAFSHQNFEFIELAIKMSEKESIK